MTNHEAIKIILGFSLTLVTGFVFYNFKQNITTTFGAENYYLALSYAAVVPPIVMNKIYDRIVNCYYERKQTHLAKEIDTEKIREEHYDIKEQINLKRNDNEKKIKEFKEIEISRKTLS